MSVQGEQEQYGPTKQEVIEQLLSDMTPEIQKEIIKEQREKYENQFEQEVQLLKQKAKQSCEGAVEEKIEELHKEQIEDYKIRKDKLDDRSKELNLMKLTIMAELEPKIHEQCLQQLDEEKDKLIKQFQSQNNQSKKQNQLENEIRERIQYELKESKQFEIQRKEKLMKLNYKKKFEEEKEYMQREYQNNIDKDFTNQMAEIEQQRAEIAKATAVNNLKVKQFKEEKQLLLQHREAQEKDFNQVIETLQNELQSLNQELESLQLQSFQQQQLLMLQQMQQQQASRRDNDQFQNNDKKQRIMNSEYEQDQRYLYLRQQQEEDNYNDYPQDNLQLQAEIEAMRQEELNKRNNVFAQSQNNTNEYFNLLNNSQGNNYDEQKMGFTTQLLNNNQFASTKSPFLLSLTNKLNLNQDHKRFI